MGRFTDYDLRNVGWYHRAYWSEMYLLGIRFFDAPSIGTRELRLGMVKKRKKKIRDLIIHVFVGHHFNIINSKACENFLGTGGFYQITQNRLF